MHRYQCRVSVRYSYSKFILYILQNRYKCEKSNVVKFNTKKWICGIDGPCSKQLLPGANRLSSLEENAVTVYQRLEVVETLSTQTDNRKLKAKLIDLEGRSRCCNVQLIWLPEGIEGPQPTQFFSILLQEPMRKSSLQHPNWTGLIAVWPSNQSHNLLSSFFHPFQKREWLVREARSGGTPLNQGHSFKVYEAYSLMVLEQRKEYKKVMSSLYKMGFKPSHLYPPRLYITQQDDSRVNDWSRAVHPSI